MILIIIGLITIALIGFIKYHYSYWWLKGFPNLSPTIPSGNLESFTKRKTSFGMAVYDLYLATKEPFVGIYLFFRPAVLIRDAELVKRILTTDFNYFHDRGVHSNVKNNPLSGNLFSLPGEEWKAMRTKLTPTFTSGKLKKMFSMVEKVGNSMQNYLNETIPNDGKVIELRELSTKYSTDVIASTFFGLDVDTFTDPNNKFAKIRNEINRKHFLGSLAVATSFMCPKLFDLLQLYRTNRGMVESLIQFVKESIEYRDSNHVTRNDFMQLLLQLRNTGQVKADGDWDAKGSTGGLKSMTIEQCAAQVFIFYIAGLETTASTISFCLYEISQNADVKNKLLKDINEALEKHQGVLTYDCIQDMKYLDLCISETIRKYPGLPILNRECTHTYQIPNSSFVIDKGTPVIISLMGLHRDPVYFPDPLKFMPERFADEVHSYNEDAYIPFGDGPRACIGFRQGKLSAKVAVVKILTTFKIDAVETRELEFDNFSVGLMPKGGANVKFIKI